MSARRDKQAPQGEAPHTPRTDQSFIAGVGLAGAAAATVVLGVVIGLGAASFQIWPESAGPASGSVIELEVPVDVAVELPAADLFVSSSPLDIPSGATGAPAPAGGGNGPGAPDGGADGALVPGQGPAAPAAPPSGTGDGDGDLGEAGEDVEPGDEDDGDDDGSGSVPDPVVPQPPSRGETRPSHPGASGASRGNGRGSGNGSGRVRGNGQVTQAPDTGSAGRHGRVESGRGARYPR